MKEIILVGNSTSDNENIDKNLIKALAGYYSNMALGDTYEFENSLIDYFKNHYKEITGNKYNEFLIKFSNISEEGDLYKIARQYSIDTKSFENKINSNLVIKDGLIYEENNELNIIYATEKSINSEIENLYSSSLYYKHLAKENNFASDNATTLQTQFIKYANQKRN